MLSSARGLGLPRGLVVRRFVVLFIAVFAFVLAPWPATAAPPDNFPDRILSGTTGLSFLQAISIAISVFLVVLAWPLGRLYALHYGHRPRKD